MRRILLVLATMAAAVLVASGATLAAPAYTHAGKITINDSESPPTTATPYPSEIVVSGLPGLITDVNVKLRGFSHTYPDDVDMQLVGPSGNLNVTVMSDVGGTVGVRNTTLVLDDQATDFLPDGGPLTGGTYKPTDSDTDGGDTFPGYTPSGLSELSLFNNTNPNGTWRLYVVDDATQDAGQLRSWSLDITTATS